MADNKESVETTDISNNTSFENMEFYVMFEDEMVSHIKVKNNQLVEAKTLDKPFYKQPFLAKPITLSYVKNFLNRRSIQKDKVDIADIMNNLGLKEYDTFKILRKTHGASHDDFTWIKFADENIGWEDVKVRGRNKK
jgi:hypothetical protein